MVSKKKAHGGKRPGAGRKFSPYTERQEIGFRPEQLEWLKDQEGQLPAVMDGLISAAMGSVMSDKIIISKKDAIEGFFIAYPENFAALKEMDREGLREYLTSDLFIACASAATGIPDEEFVDYALENFREDYEDSYCLSKGVLLYESFTVEKKRVYKIKDVKQDKRVVIEEFSGGFCTVTSTKIETNRSHCKHYDGMPRKWAAMGL